MLGHKLGAMVVQEEDISSQLSIKEKELDALKRMAGVFSETPSFGDATSTAQVYLSFIIFLARKRTDYRSGSSQI